MEPRPHHALDEARRLLAGCVLFRGLSAAQRSLLVERSQIRKYGAGESIFLMGDPGDCMMAVLDGTVRISVTSPGGKQIALTIMQAGDFFGEIALLDGKERTADATAMTACSVAVLYRRDILSFLDQHPDGWPSLVEVLCDRLRRTTLQISEVALLELPVRLAKALLRIGAAGRDIDALQEPFEIQLSQRELGYIVGATRESVNKCIREWQRAGFVQIDGTTMKIFRPGDLQALAESDEQ